MSHFYGKVQGNRGEGTRCGTKGSGMQTHTAGWQGAISTYVYYDEKTQQDRFEVALIPWQGSGGWSRSLVKGILDSNGDETMYIEHAFNGIQMVLRALNQYNDKIHSK